MASGIVLGGRLYCRKAPNTSAESYGQFSTGEVIEVSVHDQNWWRTSWNGSIGYVKRDYVAVALDRVKVVGTNVNVRNAPTTSSSRILYTLSSPTAAEVSYVQENWLYITPDNKTESGWINAAYVEKVADSSSSGDNDAGFGYGPVFLGLVRGENVNVRKGPGTSYAPVGTFGLNDNTYLQQIVSGGTAEQREAWLKCDGISTNVTGFVYARYISVSNMLSGYQNRGIDGYQVSLRCRPSSSSELIDHLTYNDRVVILGQSGNWYRVGNSKGIGWIDGQYLANS